METTVRRRRLNSSVLVGSIRSRRPSGIGFVGSSRSWLMRSWTRHLVSRAITAWCRQKRRANPRYVRMTKQVEAAIAGAYLSGTNTRRVRRALGALFKGAVGKDVVAEPGGRCRRTGRRGAGARWLKRMLPGWSWMARYGSTARRHRSRCWLCWVFAAMGRRCSCGAQHGRRERGGLGRSAG